MTKIFQYIFSGLVGALFLSPLALFALVSYPPGALLQPNDVTSSHIRDGTIVDADISASAVIPYSKLNLAGGLVNADISASAGISARKITDGGPLGGLIFSDGTKHATSTSFVVATSSPQLSIIGGRIAATSTSFGGWNQTWPSTDGASGYALTTNGAGTLGFSALTASLMTTTGVAGEALTIRDPVYFLSPMEAFVNTASVSAISTVGDTTTNQQSAQSFSTTQSGTVFSITSLASANGSPADSVRLGIQADASGSPSGTYLAYCDTLGSSLAAYPTYTTINCTLNTPVTLTGGTLYHFVMSRTGALHNVNNYDDAGNAVANCGSNTYKLYNGTTWSASTHCMRAVFTVIGEARVYRAGTLNATSTNVIGFAQSSVSSDASVTVVVGGTMTGFSNLTVGAKYYLGSASGTVQNFPAATSKSLGYATASTSMLFIPN